MRRVRNAVIGIIVFFIVFWLFFAYMTLELNPFQWNEAVRYFHAVLSIIVGVFGGLALEDFKNG